MLALVTAFILICRRRQKSRRKFAVKQERSQKATKVARAVIGGRPTKPDAEVIEMFNESDFPVEGVLTSDFIVESALGSDFPATNSALNQQKDSSSSAPGKQTFGMKMVMDDGVGGMDNVYAMKYAMDDEKDGTKESTA